MSDSRNNNDNSEYSDSVPETSPQPKPTQRPTAWSPQDEKMQAYRQIHYAHQPSDPYTGARPTPFPSQNTGGNQYPAQYPGFHDGTTFNPGYQNQSPQHQQQYQGGQRQQQQHYQQQFQQQQYPPQQQYQNQYPPQQNFQGYLPQQGQYQQYQNYNNNPYPHQRNQRGFFSNLFDSAFVSSLAILTIQPWVTARKMLSIRPETTPQEKAERYRYALPQLLREKGVASLWQGYGTSMIKAPAIALDLLIFHTMKDSSYPYSWLSNVFLASNATALRYFLYQPIWISIENMTLDRGFSAKDHFNNVKNAVRHRYQAHGFKGLYPNLPVNLPYLMMLRGIQLGTIDRSMQTMRYNEGNTSLFRKFLVCYSVTIIARFLTYPIELVKNKMRHEEAGSFFSTIKNVISRAKGVVSSGEWTFRQATARSFQASSSALAFAMFYHLRDEPLPRY